MKETNTDGEAQAPGAMIEEAGEVRALEPGVSVPRPDSLSGQEWVLPRERRERPRGRSISSERLMIRRQDPIPLALPGG